MSWAVTSCRTTPDSRAIGRPEPADQHGHPDVLVERRVRREGSADLLGEAGTLVRRRQLIGAQRRAEAADDLVDVQLVVVFSHGLGHVKARSGQALAVTPLAGLVGATGRGGPGALPSLQPVEQRLR